MSGKSREAETGREVAESGTEKFGKMKTCKFIHDVYNKFGGCV